MAEKEEIVRITLRFNSDNPDQLVVSKILKQQGRGITKFVTSAVLHYARHKESAITQVQQTIDRETLEKLVLEILEKYHVVYSEERQKELLQTQSVEEDEEQDMPQAESEIISDDLEKVFGKQGILSIANTLSAFQSG